MQILTQQSAFLSLLPSSPGVYKFFNSRQELIYVGKAKNLKKRVSSYFNKRHEDGKTRVLVSQINAIDFIIVDSELDALLLENNLIKENKPRYNILLKDDKTYPWLCLKKEPFPRLFATRKRFNNKDEYFGPFPKGKIHKQLLQLIHDLYPIRTCSLDLSLKAIEKKKYKVCLEFHLKRCLGPCIDTSVSDIYHRNIEDIRLLLKGKSFTLIQNLKKRMTAYANDLNFEKAQEIKNKIDALESYRAKSIMVINPSVNCDIFTAQQEGKLLYYNYSWVREGRITLSVSDHINLPMNEPMEEICTVIWHQLHIQFNSLENEIISNISFQNDIASFRFIKPLKGDKAKLVEFSMKNLRSKPPIAGPKKIINQDQRLMMLQEALRLSLPPNHIECFDNSNFHGTNAVAACVVFKNGLPASAEYRHFNIKTVQGSDDFASMKEIVFRRYRRCLDENVPLPNLIVIDGGKGQLSAAMEALDSLKLKGKIPIIGLAKKLEEIYFPGDRNSLKLSQNNPGLLLLQHIRNEAHRFGITHHRNKRSSNFLQTEFESIPGIGPNYLTKIQKHFPTLESFVKASEEEQNQKLGIRIAQLIRKHLINS